jgi:hypothetical protein
MGGMFHHGQDGVANRTADPFNLEFQQCAAQQDKYL